MKAARPKVRQDRGDDESIARGAPLGAAAPLPRGAPPAVTRRPSGEGYANGARRVDRRPIGLRRAEQRRIVALVEHASTLGGSPRSAAVSPVCDCQGGGVPSCHGAELPQASWTTELRGTWWPYDQRHVQLRRRRAEPTRPGDRPKGGNQPGPAGVPGSVRSAPGGHHAQTPAALARPGPRRSGRRGAGGRTAGGRWWRLSPAAERGPRRHAYLDRAVLQSDRAAGRPWHEGDHRQPRPARPSAGTARRGVVLGRQRTRPHRGSAGATTVDVAATESEPSADAASRPATPTASGPIEASVPPAWLVVVALAALLGALGGTRLAARRRS